MYAIFAALLYMIFPCQAREYSFPPDFKFGTATSAYQVEGAWNVSGKGESIWDRYIHENPEEVLDQSNADVACDAYNQIKEDVRRLKFLGVDFYRFSISWSRILPNGKTDDVNPDGIRYYNELIDELLANDIEPVVTMYHWDLPQTLEDEGGWTNPAMVAYFEKYAEVLYENFGDRVRDWITFNQPFTFCYFGYGGQLFPPRLNDKAAGYRCGRTVLLAHAKAYHLYNDRYRETQKGRIGISLNIYWLDPMENSWTDKRAVASGMDYIFGWFAHPIFSKRGDYPPAMKTAVEAASTKDNLPKTRLAELTAEEVETIKGTADFLGVNHYTSFMCTRIGDRQVHPGLFYFGDADLSCISDLTAEGSASLWLKVVPEGFRKALNWIKDQYGNPEVVVTENGFSTLGHLIYDCRRVNYYNLYVTELLKAIHEDGCNVSAFTAWSFMDNFEWRSGYFEKFGLFSVDFSDPAKTRTAKMSAHVYKRIIEERKIDWKYTPKGFPECEWLRFTDEL